MLQLISLTLSGLWYLVCICVCLCYKSTHCQKHLRKKVDIPTGFTLKSEGKSSSFKSLMVLAHVWLLGFQGPCVNSSCTLLIMSICARRQQSAHVIHHSFTIHSPEPAAMIIHLQRGLPVSIHISCSQHFCIAPQGFLFYS